MINLKSIRKLFFMLLYAFPILLLGEPESLSIPNSYKGKKSLLNRIDQNNDGVVSMEEFTETPKLHGVPEEKISKMFSYLDKNNDGSLSSKELPHPPKHHSHKRPFREHLHKADLDRDGKISKEEFLINPPPRLESTDKDDAESLFSFMDKNNDGYLSPEDRPHLKEGELRHRFRERRTGKDRSSFSPREHLDLNSDDVLDFEEFRQGERAQKLSENEKKALFQRLDYNQDGVISRADRRAGASEESTPRDTKRPSSQR